MCLQVFELIIRHISWKFKKKIFLLKATASEEMDRSLPLARSPVVYITGIPNDLNLKDARIHEILTAISVRFGGIRYD